MTLRDIDWVDSERDWKSAKQKWYDTHYDVLLDTYIELVRTRGELAQARGYSDYAEMAFAEYELGYTPEMLQRLLDDLAVYLVPVQDRFYYDLGGYYDADVTVSLDGFMDSARVQVYRLPPDELTPSMVHNIARRVYDEYGYLFGEYEFETNAWLTESELYYAPFNTLCYSLAGIVAFDLWGIARTDEARAVALYDLLVESNPANIEAATTAIGVDSLFAPGRMRTLAALIKEHLLDATWTTESGAIPDSPWQQVWESLRDGAAPSHTGGDERDGGLEGRP